MNLFLTFFLTLCTFVSAHVSHLHPYSIKNHKILKTHTEEFCMKRRNFHGFSIAMTCCFEIPMSLPFNQSHFLRISRNNEKYFHEHNLLAVAKDYTVYYLGDEEDDSKKAMFLKELYVKNITGSK